MKKLVILLVVLTFVSLVFVSCGGVDSVTTKNANITTEEAIMTTQAEITTILSTQTLQMKKKRRLRVFTIIS